MLDGWFKYPLVAWDKVCSPIEVGGLRIGRIVHFNQALLGNGFGGLVTKSLTFGFGDRLLPPNMGRTGGWSTKVSRGGHGQGCDLWHSI